ncbi:hypothetical protein [Aliiruegeria sabulilitoris]|uniref:hypothetical protein n=1 Tax=Aliiruegeria sabulilitoris TaxID=1510458 RepID=UPI00082CDA40|nr:hypothetical protein [Aliiruegeria sabulilitoris]NDR59301.1 hypothetical protein [Pseudoruegeria sp. M32A2M]
MTFAGRLPLVTLVVTCAAVLVHLVFGWEPALLAGRIGFVGMCLAAIPRYTLREWALSLLAIGCSVALLLQGGDATKLLYALDLAVFFGCFIALLTLLKEAAECSDSVLQVGRFLTTQPSGRRYYATAFGGHALAVFLNFAAVSLMAPLIQKGAQDNSGRIDPDLERRQISALLRGFSWFVIWAPTSLAQAVLLTLFPGVDWPYLVALGLGTAILMTLLGRALDRYEWRHAVQTGRSESPPVPRRAFAVLAFVCVSLIGTTVVIEALAGYTIAQSLMLVAPGVTVIWFVLQGAPFETDSPLQRFAAFGAVLDEAAPSLLRTAVVLGLSGYIGRTAAYVLPTAEIAQWLELHSVSPWVFLAALPILVTLGGQIALSPILLVVFFGELVHQLPELPADPTLIVFSLSIGWALGMSASPNATATLLVSAICKIPPTTLTWRWNSRYALLCYAAFLVMLTVLV